MIRKLRLRFIGLSMLSLFIVLFIIVSTILIINFSNITRNADSLLTFLSENDGTFPAKNDFPPKDDISPEENPLHNKPSSLPFSSPETPYESRFFTVYLDSNEEISSIDTGRIAAINAKTASAYAKTIIEAGNVKGFYGDYRFLHYSPSNSNELIVFLDCGRNLSTFKNFAITSCLISLSGMLAVFLLLVLFSGRIIRPVSESYEKQKRFITDAGHEIKTPLTIIQADTDILSMDLGENEWITDIKKQTERLTSLTGDLICLSKMEEGTPLSQTVIFPFSEVVEEMVSAFHSKATTQHKILKADITPMLSLLGDEKAIRQLISILLDNAIKYSPTDTSISVSVEKINHNISLQIGNISNIPLKKDQLSHLFDRFYRADTSHDSFTPGYGIGLSIAAAIVKTHKGKITATLEINDFFRITVILPLAN